LAFTYGLTVESRLEPFYQNLYGGGGNGEIQFLKQDKNN
jgi:hypothetical protein